MGPIMILPREKANFDEGVAMFRGQKYRRFSNRVYRRCPNRRRTEIRARSSGEGHAGLETRDTAGSEACGTTTEQSDSFFTGPVSGCAQANMPLHMEPGFMGVL